MIRFTATPRDVARAFATVLPHVGSDAHLPMLTVVNVEVSGATLTVAATDRFTLAIYRADLGEWAAEDEEVAPAEPLTVNLYARDLRRLFAFGKANAKGRATWTLDAERLSVEFEGGDTLSVRTVDVHFVDYRNLLAALGERPEVPTDHLNVDPERVQAIVRSAQAVRECGPERSAPLHVWAPASPLKPVLVTVGHRFLGLLMPVRPNEAPALALEPFLAAPVAPALPSGVA